MHEYPAGQLVASTQPHVAADAQLVAPARAALYGVDAYSVAHAAIVVPVPEPSQYDPGLQDKHAALFPLTTP